MLQSTGRLANVHELLVQKKQDTLRNAPDVTHLLTDKVLSSLPAVLSNAFRSFFPGTEEQDFHLKDCPDQKEELVLLCGKPRSSFKITGFSKNICFSARSNDSELNTTFFEKEDRKINGVSTFWSASEKFVVVSDGGRAVVIGANSFAMVTKYREFHRDVYASCDRVEFWQVGVSIMSKSCSCLCHLLCPL